MGSVLYTGMGHESIMLCSALCSFKEELEGHLPHTNSPLAATMSYERCRRVANLGTKSTVLGLEPATIRVTPRWLTHWGRTTVLAYGSVARASGLSKGGPHGHAANRCQELPTHAGEACAAPSVRQPANASRRGEGDAAAGHSPRW